MSRKLGPTVKFTAFVVTMLMLTVCLFAVFGDFRGGSTMPYSAVFTDVSDLHSGDSVRMAGIRIGTVKTILLQQDQKVVVDFDADRTIKLTTGTRAAVRYLNLVGDRYLEIVDGPGSTDLMPPGSRIQSDHTAPALDLDVLLNGLKPVVQGLNPQDVNQLTASLIRIMQGEGGAMESLLSQTSSFTSALADNAQTLERLIDNLNTTMATLAADGDRFAGAIDRLRRLVSELSAERDPIGAAVDSLSNGTASLVGLLAQARPPLAGTVAQVKRLAPSLDADKDRIDGILQKLPEDYRKLARMGSYGSFFNYYLCGVTLRVSDLQGRTAVFPWIKETTGRCAENP